MKKPTFLINAESKLSMMNDLKKLRDDLHKLGNTPKGKDVYDWGVQFFNIITQFQDNHNLDNLASFKSPSAKVIVKHIQNAGHGAMCRAKPGETVTLDNLYLGNIYGIWTKTARTFKEIQNIDIQSKIHQQLSSFVSSHREPMIDLIDNVLKTEHRPSRLLTAFARNSQNTK